MLITTSMLLVPSSRKGRFDMANITTNSQNKTELLDQMLEDLAGEELSEFDNEFDLNNDLDIFADTDEFAEIDRYH